MDLRHIEIYAWYASAIVEGALILRLARWRPPYCFPLLLTFLAWDWSRAVVLIPVSICFPAAYTFTWSSTEHLDIALLCAAGIEAWEQVRRIHIPPWMYTVVIVPLMLMGVVLPSTHTVPLVEPLFQARMIITAAVSIALVLSMAYLRRATMHAVLMAAFCAVDVSGYLGIVMGSPRFFPESYIMVSQLVILTAWLIFARRLD